MSQLALLMTVTLLVANLIAILSIQRLGTLLTPATRNGAVESVAVSYLISQQHPTSAPFALERPSGARFWISAIPEVLPFAMKEEERRLSAGLISQYPLPAGSRVFFQLERTDGGLARAAALSLSWHNPLRLRGSFSLGDGRYFNSIQTLEPAWQWLPLFSLSLLIMMPPLLLVSLYFTYRVVRPIRRLARASEAVSRGEWDHLLPVTGPKEAEELTQNFNMMQQRIAQYLAGQTQMLAAMSHDFNTPLTALRLQITLLEAGPEREDMLESLDELQEMVRETLSYIRGETQQEATEPCSLSQILNDVVARYRQTGWDVRWRGDRHLTIDCRPLAIKRLLSNVIDNGLHYGGGRVVISVEQRHNEAVVEVLDFGPGIPENLINSACEPFVQLKPEGKTPGTLGGGLGLGLAIAKACAQAHGGELRLANHPSAGLCVTLRLPKSPKMPA